MSYLNIGVPNLFQSLNKKKYSETFYLTFKKPRYVVDNQLALT